MATWRRSASTGTVTSGVRASASRSTTRRSPSSAPPDAPTSASAHVARSAKRRRHRTATAGHVYSGRCRHLTDRQRNARRAERPPAVRFRAEGDAIAFDDIVAGAVEGVPWDVVLRRNDGVPAYNLAVVVDDAAAGIDVVVRGDDLLLGDAEPDRHRPGAATGRTALRPRAARRRRRRSPPGQARRCDHARPAGRPGYRRGSGSLGAGGVDRHRRPRRGRHGERAGRSLRPVGADRLGRRSAATRSPRGARTSVPAATTDC